MRRRQDVSKLVRAKAKQRVCTLNIGTLTGKTGKLARALRKRRIDICALQEIRWCGGKSCDVERGKNGYFGSADVSEGFRDSIRGIERFDDWLMKPSIISADRTIHRIHPQTGRPDTEKHAFWPLLDEKTCSVHVDDYIIIAGELNGHVGPVWSC